jgi:hypothetical protein
MNKIMSLAACTTACAVAHAQSWNLATDFSITTNPNGQWSYGSLTMPGGSFTHFTRTAQIPYQVSKGAVAEWVGSGYDSGFELFPYISKFYGDPGTTVTVDNGTTVENPGTPLIKRAALGVGTHPAPPGLGYATVRWIAPATKTYLIMVSFSSADVNVGATTDVHVLRNGVSLFSELVNGVGSVQNYFSGLAGLTLNAGDVIDLAVGPNGDYSSDSTGIDAMIQYLPQMLNCVQGQSTYKVVALSNSVSAEVSPNSSGTSSVCAVPATVSSSWYIKTTTDGGVTWQWVNTLAMVGLGKS